MNKHSNKRDIGEIFTWIKIPSKYEALKKKLQQNLVEILYSEGNAERLQAKNEEFNNNNDSNVLRRDSISLSPSKIAKKKRNVSLQFENSENTKPVTHFKKRRIRPASSNFGANTERNTSETNQLLTGFAAESEKMLQKKLNEFNWNNSFERTFQSYKKYAQGTFIGYDSMNRWQTIGMQPIIQMLGLEEKLDLYREQLLRQFREEGQQMKESEIMFLINTSELLDSNIDRVQFQSMLDFISEDDIQRLELCIAENILKKYATVTEQLKSIRNTFLNLKSNKTAKNNEKNSLKGTAIDALKAEQARKAKQRMWKGQIERIKKMLVNKAPQISYFLQLRSNPYVQHFAQQLKKSIAQKDFRKLPMKQKETHLETFAKRNYPAKTPKLLFSYRQGQDDVKITLKDSLKICHPTSRIILGLGELHKAEELKIRGDMKSLSDLQIKQVKDLEVQKKENYKYVNRMLNQSSLEGKRDQFLEYYSSGPSRKMYEEQIDMKKPEKDASGAVEVVKEEKEQDEQAKMALISMNQKRRREVFEDKEVENQAVIVIQKWTRMLLEQKIFKTAIAKKREIQEKKMFEILKKWKESKDLIVFLRDQSRKIQYAKQQSLLRAKSRVSSSNHVISPTNRSGLSPSNKGSSLYNKDQDMGENDNLHMIKCIQNDQNNNELEKGTGISALSKFVEIQQFNESQQLIKERSNSISSFQSKTSSKGKRKVEEGLAIFKQNIKTKNNPQKKQKQSNIDESLITTTGSHTRSGSQIISNAMLQSPRISDNFSKYSQNDSDHHLKHSPQKQEDNSKDLSHQVVNPHLLLSSGKFPWASAGSQSKTAKIVNMRDRTKQHEEMLIKQKKLLAAAKQGSLQTIKSTGFVYYASDFDAADDQGKCALFYTIMRGLDDFTQFLIKGGANVNFRCSEGNTPLHAAFKLGRPSIIVSLVDAGGDLNRLNDNGFTPLGFGSPGLLHELGLDAGVNQVRLDTKEVKTTSYKFNNNQLFKEKHDTVDGNANNIIKEQNSPYTLLKKRKERRVDEEIPEEQTFYQYLPANSMVDRMNYDKNYGGVQIENSLGHRQIPFVQSFVEPSKRNQSGGIRNYQN